MSDAIRPTLLEAVQSGKCFKRSGNIYKFKDDAMYMWVQGGWVLTAENWQRVEYCDDPSLTPRACTFMEAWEHMKKYPKRKVCLFRDMECMYHDGSIWIADNDRPLFLDCEDNEIIDSNDWKLIPQKEGD